MNGKQTAVSMETCNLAQSSPNLWGLLTSGLRRWWWLGTNWLLIGLHWQISHLHQLWHWLGANNVFVRRGRRMSGRCQQGALVRTRDNNGLVAANYVSKAIKVFLMFGQRWLWRDKQHETGADTLRIPGNKEKRENSSHILPLLQCSFKVVQILWKVSLQMLTF